RLRLLRMLAPARCVCDDAGALFLRMAQTNRVRGTQSTDDCNYFERGRCVPDIPFSPKKVRASRQAEWLMEIHTRYGDICKLRCFDRALRHLQLLLAI